MHLGFGAKPPKPTITVTRGTSTFENPLMGAARLAWAKSHPETTHDISALRMIPWPIVQRKLLELNPRLSFEPLPDGRVVIILDRPSPGAIAAYEGLSYYERKEIDAPGIRATPGPRVRVIASSSNVVEPYVEIRDGTPGHLQRPIARALVTIIKALVREDAFTWEAAERKFGMRLRGVPATHRFMRYSAHEWNARRDGVISITSGSTKATPTPKPTTTPRRGGAPSATR